MNKEFTAILLQSEAKGGWTYLIWPESVQFFGTRGLVKVRGTIDGHQPGLCTANLTTALNGVATGIPRPRRTPGGLSIRPR